MQIRKLLAAMAALNGFSLSLLRRDPASVRPYISQVSRLYNDVAGNGLKSKYPLEHLFEIKAATFDPATRIQLPTELVGGGGTSILELVHLAGIAQVLHPRCVFEIGTFTALTTSLFILNAPEARVITMDLPLDAEVEDGYIGTDVTLVKERRVGHFTRLFGLEGRYEQKFGDSMMLDPAPLRGQVDLAFIDGSHALPYVVNDTEKMAEMLTPVSMVLWHDYGGVGEFFPLTQYLEHLSHKCAIYKIPGTSLAWAMGSELRKGLGRN